MDLTALDEALMDVMEDAVAQTIARGGNVRWYVVRGWDADARIVFETSRYQFPLMWALPDSPRGEEDTLVLSPFLEDGYEWLLERWRAERDLWFLCFYSTALGPESPYYVDAATTEWAWCERFVWGERREDAPPKARKRPEMQADLKFRGALQRWEEGDNGVCAEIALQWALKAAETSPAERRSKVRWSDQ